MVYRKRKKLLLGASSGIEEAGGSYFLSRKRDKGKKRGYYASVEVQPRYKVKFISFDNTKPVSKGMKELNVVEFDKKSNVTKFLKSKGFTTPNHQTSFSCPADSAYENGTIKFGMVKNRRVE